MLFTLFSFHETDMSSINTRVLSDSRKSVDREVLIHFSFILLLSYLLSKQRGHYVSQGYE